MAILVDPATKVLIQGITGTFGACHTRLSIEYGTKIVAGVTPGKGGQVFDNRIPIFDSVAEAVRETGATASCIFVPRANAADAIIEAAEAGLQLAVCITEGIPIHEMLVVKRALSMHQMKLVGPNCPGIVTPGPEPDSRGGCRIGIAPGYIHRQGHIGVVSRSGTLTYEAVWQITRRGAGQSTCVGIGGDPVCGLSLLDVVRLFNEDPDTHGIVIIGEIGGSAEQETAEWIQTHCRKPVAAFVAGTTAPSGRRLGHAGAIANSAPETAAAKIAVFRDCRIPVADSPSAIADTILKLL